MAIQIQEWEFTKSKAAKAWLSGGTGPSTTILLPHCWNLTDTFQYDVEYYRGWGSYRTTFDYTPDPEHPHTVLRSNGFYGTGEVWLNGKKVASFDAQYLGLRIPLNNLHPGKHQLAIRLTNRCAKTVLPGIKMPDFVLFGGLACDECSIEQHAEAYVEPTGLRVMPVDANSYEISGEISDFSAISTKNPRLQIRIEDTTIDLEIPVNQSTFSQKLTVENPTLWSIDHPHRYNLQAQLIWDGGEDQKHHRKIGFRTANFTPEQGFVLNGERVFLHGCNRHEAMPGFGNALPVAQHREDALQLKAAGVNLVRLSHYPQHPAFLDACDELGICIYAEIATWKSVAGGKWLENAKRQMRDMIVRDGFHPSVILWGLGNETRKRDPYLQLQAVVRELDPLRKTIYAENHIYRGRRENTLDLPDLLGVNYEMDALAEAMEVSKEGVVLVSECSSAPTERGDFEAELAQIKKLDTAIQKMKPHPGVAGFTMWCFADYATLRKKRYKRFSGIVDAWRIPKPGFDYFRAQFSNEPMVALHGDWSIDGPQKRTMHLFSNQSTGRIEIDGDVVYEWTEAQPHHTLDLTFTAKTINITAGERSLARAPHGPPARMVIESLNSVAHQLRVLDAEDQWVRNFNDDITLPGIEGKLVNYRPDNGLEIRSGTAAVFLNQGIDLENVRTLISHWKFTV